MKRKTIIEWVVVIGIILVFAYTGWHKPLVVLLQRGLIQTGLFSPDTSKPPVVLHNGIYNLSLMDEQGEVVELESLAGDVIFINFWATWCPPCRAEMPGINALFQKVQDPALHYVILTEERDFSKAIAYKKEQGFDFPIYQLIGPLPRIYQEPSIPRSYVVSHDGKLIMEHTGLADYDSRSFRDFLKQALEKRPGI